MQIKAIKDELLLRNALVVDPFKQETYETDILIEKGKIKSIGKSIAAEKIKNKTDLKGLYVAPGFVDLHTHLREPGNEDEETIATGVRAALAGGFTKICCMPNTDPAIDTQEAVRFIYRQAENLLAEVYPIAAITKGRQGAELTNMVELAQAGAVAFSDDGTPLQNSRLMRFALEYSKLTAKPVINHAEDPELKSDGLMNEGIVSAQLGLPGNPAQAEEIMINRDLQLAKFTGARLHVPHVSTAGAVELIRKAKAEGVKVSAEATPHHFSLTDEYLRTFDANGKVAPPLRTESDRQALIAGLKDGTIDAIATDHAPHTIDTKETSFDLASYGMIGLETAFALAMTHLVHPGHLTLVQLIKLLTVNPATIMNLPLAKLQNGAEANLTIFDPNEWWIFNRKNIYSRSQNTPFLSAELTGRIKAVITKSHYVSL
ncbi:MAG: dihydroorotase [Candidatus Marinimicrobia bacterium]|nr:dihydroorotase [Candidatus Neomarinimicrobiota bacterium]